MIAVTFPGRGSASHGFDDGGSPAVEAMGERPHLAERLLVTPVAGVFHRRPELDEGVMVAPGDELGCVSGHPVRSAFGGRLMTFLAVEGERVTPRQPVAWLASGTT